MIRIICHCVLSKPWVKVWEENRQDKTPYIPIPIQHAPWSASCCSSLHWCWKTPNPHFLRNPKQRAQLHHQFGGAFVFVACIIARDEKLTPCLWLVSSSFVGRVHSLRTLQRYGLKFSDSRYFLQGTRKQAAHCSVRWCPRWCEVKDSTTAASVWKFLQAHPRLPFGEKNASQLLSALSGHSLFWPKLQLCQVVAVRTFGTHGTCFCLVAHQK